MAKVNAELYPNYQLAKELADRWKSLFTMESLTTCGVPYRVKIPLGVEGDICSECPVEDMTPDQVVDNLKMDYSTDYLGNEQFYSDQHEEYTCLIMFGYQAFYNLEDLQEELEELDSESIKMTLS